MSRVVRQAVKTLPIAVAAVVTAVVAAAEVALEAAVAVPLDRIRVHNKSAHRQDVNRSVESRCEFQSCARMFAHLFYCAPHVLGCMRSRSC